MAGETRPEKVSKPQLARDQRRTLPPRIRERYENWVAGSTETCRDVPVAGKSIWTKGWRGWISYGNEELER